jgi:8-oxo-dGTP diphosphatase
MRSLAQDIWAGFLWPMRAHRQARFRGPFSGTSVVVHRPDGHVLMGVRKGSHGAGHHAFPGGRIEYGEGIAEAARRGLLEETGLDLPIEPLHAHPTTTAITDDGDHWITHYFVAHAPMEAKPEAMEPHKCGAWAWHPQSDLPSPLFEPISCDPGLIRAVTSIRGPSEAMVPGARVSNAEAPGQWGYGTVISGPTPHVSVLWDNGRRADHFPDQLHIATQP